MGQSFIRWLDVKICNPHHHNKPKFLGIGKKRRLPPTCPQWVPAFCFFCHYWRFIIGPNGPGAIIFYKQIDYAFQPISKIASILSTFDPKRLHGLPMALVVSEYGLFQGNPGSILKTDFQFQRFYQNWEVELQECYYLLTRCPPKVKSAVYHLAPLA